jgi:hypothetical protein
VGPLICRLAVAAVGACGVVLLGELLRQLSWVCHWRTGYTLAAAHALAILGLMVVAPLYIRLTWGSPYGDVYVPYLLVPGIHVTYPADQLFGGLVFRGLLGQMESFPASVLCVIVGPGLVGITVGGLQWWVVGAVWDRLVGLCRTASGVAADRPRD